MHNFSLQELHPIEVMSLLILSKLFEIDKDEIYLKDLVEDGYLHYSIFQDMGADDQSIISFQDTYSVIEQFDFEKYFTDTVIVRGNNPENYFSLFELKYKAIKEFKKELMYIIKTDRKMLKTHYEGLLGIKT